MSALSFPQHLPSGDSGSHEDQFYSPSYDTSSSFQMNPLSSHPPRTPRASIISNSTHSYHPNGYDSQGDTGEKVSAEELELDEQEDKVKEAEKRILKEDVWREIFVTSNGRDKGLKLIQYSIRVVLLFHASVASTRLLQRPKNVKWSLDIVPRLQSTASGISFSRKLLLLFDWLQPLTAIRAQQSVPFSAESSIETAKRKQRSFVHTALYAPPPVLLELVQDVATDVATFSLLGLFSKKLGERAARFADWCWLLGTLVALVENGVERQMITSLQGEVEGRMYNESMTGASAKSKPKASKIDEKELSRLQKQDYWLQITRTKLLMDLIFVSYVVFNIRRASKSVKTFSGLAAAVLSAAKVFDTTKTSLVKAMISSS